MKKLDNFISSLKILHKIDFTIANKDEIYRMGIVGQFNLTFELAWKSLKAVLLAHSVAEAVDGSPREIIRLGYQFGFIDEADTWLLMLKKRNLSIHIYNEEQIDELIILIRDSFTPAFDSLANTLKEKLNDFDLK